MSAFLLFTFALFGQQSATSSGIIYFLELPKKMYNNLEIPLRNIKATRCIQEEAISLMSEEDAVEL
ncbi:hypothetical protein [Nostoc sp.]|uniref:hypothetical protein n=1 Tax=Nostoc sp. TaxID=1180 RepID=UPI002FF77FF6